jgi:hypothetical protein
VAPPPAPPPYSLPPPPMSQPLPPPPPETPTPGVMQPMALPPGYTGPVMRPGVLPPEYDPTNPIFAMPNLQAWDPAYAPSWDETWRPPVGTMLPSTPWDEHFLLPPLPDIPLPDMLAGLGGPYTTFRYGDHFGIERFEDGSIARYIIPWWMQGLPGFTGPYGNASAETYLGNLFAGERPDRGTVVSMLPYAAVAPPRPSAAPVTPYPYQDYFPVVEQIPGYGAPTVPHDGRPY